jgi:hypothetical protein
MTNPIIIFDHSDCALIILKEATLGCPSELLNNRLVSTTWKNHCNELIEFFWRDLRQEDPKGPVNVGQAMDIIKSKATANPPPLNFAKLMSVFKRHGCSLAKSSPVLVTINDFHTLQHDLTLQKIWPTLRKLYQLSALAGLPGSDAPASKIRPFLYNNKKILKNIDVLRLNDLGLIFLPPELKLLKGLQKLELSNNRLSDVSCLGAFTNLTQLRLSNNQLSDISCLGTLTNLKHLRLDNNRISDISCLGTLINLTHLWLDNNQLSDISCLAALTNLMHLRLNHNQLSDVSCLGALKKLMQLGLNNNRLSDVSCLVALTNLTWLGLNNNRLLDVSCLRALTKLKTKIPDTTPIKDLFEFPVSNVFSSNGKRTFDTAFGEKH